MAPYIHHSLAWSVRIAKIYTFYFLKFCFCLCNNCSCFTLNINQRKEWLFWITFVRRWRKRLKCGVVAAIIDHDVYVLKRNRIISSCGLPRPKPTVHVLRRNVIHRSKSATMRLFYLNAIHKYLHKILLGERHHTSNALFYGYYWCIKSIYIIHTNAFEIKTITLNVALVKRKYVLFISHTFLSFVFQNPITGKHILIQQCWKLP